MVRASLVVVLCSAACAASPPVVTPGPPRPATAPVAADVAAPPSSGSPPATAPADGLPCAGLAADACTRDALVLWSSAGQDERIVQRVGAMVTHACALGDPGACVFAGRLRLDARGGARDVDAGLAMLERGCEGGSSLACATGAAWLGDPLHARDVADAEARRERLELQQGCLSAQGEACYRAGLAQYASGDRGRAVDAYRRGCALGDSRACNNLGDALVYGEGVERDVAEGTALFARACRLGEALGCANLGQVIERGASTSQELAKGRRAVLHADAALAQAGALYRDACAAGEVYGCLHAEMSSARGASAPGPALLARWQRACDAGRDARACAFAGVLYEDGPDGVTRDPARSERAMRRACELGESRACDWLESHAAP